MRKVESDEGKVEWIEVEEDFVWRSWFQLIIVSEEFTKGKVFILMPNSPSGPLMRR